MKYSGKSPVSIMKSIVSGGRAKFITFRVVEIRSGRLRYPSIQGIQVELENVLLGLIRIG